MDTFLFYVCAFLVLFFMFCSIHWSFKILGYIIDFLRRNRD